MAEARRRAARALLLSVAGLLATPVATAADTSQTHTLQCWTDEHGKRACGDALPPSEARRQRELIDPRGVVKEVLPAEQSAQEAADANRVREEQQRREAYDRYLVQTYQDVDDLEKARDDRLAAIDGRLTLAHKALADNTAALEQLQRREKAAPASEETLDPTLKRQIREFTQARDENQRAISGIDEERNSLSNQFARDIRRYRLLKETAKKPVPR